LPPTHVCGKASLSPTKPMQAQIHTSIVPDSFGIFRHAERVG
jgi:hypothetical protein